MRLDFLILLSLSLGTTLFCEEKLPLSSSMENPSSLSFKGLVLLGPQQPVLKSSELSSSSGIVIKGVHIPGSVEKFEKWITPFYFHQPICDETISKIKQAVIQYYEKQGHPFVLIVMPPQKLTEGFLQIEVIESRVGEIKVEGDCLPLSKRLIQYLGVQPGDYMDESTVLNNIQFMNRNHFRRVDAIYSPGKEEYTTDITLLAHEPQLYHVYAGADNTGIPTTGRTRYFIGGSWDQIFGFDHNLNYQYTTSSSIKSLQAHTLQYTAFLSSKTILNLYGGYATLHASLATPSRETLGKNAQGSCRYIIPLKTVNSFFHDLSVGFDFKQTNNNIAYVDFMPQVFANAVNLTQIMIGYKIQTKNTDLPNEFSLEGYYSPGKWLSHQNDANFSALRQGAVNHWVYFRGLWKLDYFFPSRLNIGLKTRFQWSSVPLIPSEQLGIGGHDTVRGYDERQLDADTGAMLSAEIRSPSFPVFRKKGSKHSDHAYFLLFADSGFSYDKRSMNSLSKYDYLLGVGPGLRYQLSPYIHARFDLGFKLHDQPEFTGGRAMIHFSFVASY